jgi:hypothetical protein
MSVFVSSLLAQGEAYEWIYKGTDGEVYAAEPNLAEGDAFSWSWLLPDLNTSNFSWDDAVSTSFLEDGLTIYFGSKSKYYRQYFDNGDDSNPSYSLLGAPTDITSRYYEIENSKGIDIDGDGFEGTPPPTISQVLIHRDAEPHWGEAYYLTTQGDLIASQDARKYAPGDVHDSQVFYFNNFSPENFSKDQIIAREGLDTLWFYNQSTGKLYQQNFREGSEWEIRIPSGESFELTDQINGLEGDWRFDINKNGIIGERKPVIQKIIFIDSSYSNSGFYNLDNGDFVLADSSLDVGEEVTEAWSITTRSNIDLGNAIAFSWVENGVEFLLRDNISGGLSMQKFSDVGQSTYSESGSLKSIDKSSEQLYNWELDRSVDFNGDGSIGERKPLVRRIIFDDDSFHNQALYLLDNGSYALGDSSIDIGEELSDARKLTANADINLGNAVAFEWLDRGLEFLLRDTNSSGFVRQKFSEVGRTNEYTQSGNAKFIEIDSDKFHQWELDRSSDFNDDGYIGPKDIEISRVLLVGKDDNSFYLTTDRDIVMTQEELEEGDTLSGWYRKVVDKSGDPFDFKDGFRGFNWSNNGFDVIYKDQSEYKLQGFSESNEVATPRGNARNVTNKVEKYEENMDYDINMDGEIGAPLETIQKVVFNADGDSDRGIYQTSNGSLIMSEGDLQKDDVPNDSNEFLDLNGDPFEVDGDIRAYSWADRGVSLIYKEGQKYKLQLFRDRRGVFTSSGKPRDITSRVERYEDDLAIDINQDGSFGEQSAEVSEVLFSGIEGDMDMGIYRTSNNDLVASESELFQGDVFGYEIKIVDSDGDPFEPGDRIAGVRGAKGGFSLIYQNGNKFYEQLFKESRDIARQNGKERDVTRKISKLEEDISIDLNQDGNYGEEAPVISEVLFDGSQGFDWRGVYRLQNNALIISDSELEKGDTPIYYASIVDQNGYPFKPVDRIAALRDSSKGFSVIYQDGEKYLEQIFKEIGDYARTNGKPRNITKKIKKMEDDLGVDIDQDGLFGKEAPVIQTVYFDGVEGDSDLGVYGLNTGELISADSELEVDDTPRDYQIFVTNKGELYDSPGNPSGLVSSKGGYGLIYADGGQFFLQQFREARDYLRENGKPQNITKKIFKMEDEEGIDLNRDGVYGKDAPVIDEIIYGGSDLDEFGVYRMDDNNLIVAESDLKKGDIPFSVNGTLRSSKKGDAQYDVEGEILGVIFRDNKFYLFSNDGGKVLAQAYSPVGQDGQYLMEKGKASNITPKLEKYEAEYFLDFDGNGIIGSSD